MASSAPSFPPQLKTVHIEPKGNYAIITLNRPPVNGMNLSVWSDLLAALTACENNTHMRGAIFASGLEKDIFTAGNDLRELYSKSTTAERFKEFWRVQTTFLTRLYSSRLATVAAIRGACPAGGCGFAMCADYRVMTGDVRGANIGLNEVALGMSVPLYWAQLFASYLPKRTAEQCLLTGRMLSAQEALDGGLVDELVPKAELLASAEAALQRYLRQPDLGRVITKHLLRAEFAQKWMAYCDEEAANAWSALSSPQMTAALGKVLARLAGGDKDKPKAKL